jgi:hypothetical protein
MTDRNAIDNSLQVLLRPTSFKDYGLNGLQLEGSPQVQVIANRVTEQPEAGAA